METLASLAGVAALRVPLGRLLDSLRRGRGAGRKRRHERGLLDNPLPSTHEASGGLQDVAEALGEGSPTTGGEVEEHERPDRQELGMIRAILHLQKTTAREVMVPRMDVVAAEASTPPLETVRLMAEEGHSRIPIFQGQVDSVIGILHSRDLLPFLEHPEELRDLHSVVREALFVPESKTVDELLQEFQERRTQIAVVVDEYGSTAGLVTIEDLFEEIVGELRDEFDPDEAEEVQVVGESEALLDPRVTVERVEELFGVELPTPEGVDTAGGLVYTRLGKIPATGDLVDLEGLSLRVVSTRGRRIKRLRALLTNAAEGSPEAARSSPPQWSKGG